MTLDQFVRQLEETLARRAKALHDAGSYAEAAGVRYARSILLQQKQEAEPPPIDPTGK